MQTHNIKVNESDFLFDQLSFKSVNFSPKQSPKHSPKHSPSSLKQDGMFQLSPQEFILQYEQKQQEMDAQKKKANTLNGYNQNSKKQKAGVKVKIIKESFLEQPEKLIVNHLSFNKSLKQAILPNCKICMIDVNEETRQFCELCKQSFCYYCTYKKINDIQVCDLCFLRIKNTKEEKQKKKLLLLIKQHNYSLIQNIKMGKKHIQDLEIAMNNDQLKIKQSYQNLIDLESKFLILQKEHEDLKKNITHKKQQVKAAEQNTQIFQLQLNDLDEASKELEQIQMEKQKNLALKKDQLQEQMADLKREYANSEFTNLEIEDQEYLQKIRGNLKKSHFTSYHYQDSMLIQYNASKELGVQNEKKICTWF